MTMLRALYYKIKELFNSLDQYLLESYRVPTNFTELQKTIQKDKKSGSSSQSDFVWILQKENSSEKLVKIVNLDSKCELSSINEYLPCTVQRRLNNPFTFNNYNVSSI